MMDALVSRWWSARDWFNLKIIVGDEDILILSSLRLSQCEGLRLAGVMRLQVYLKILRSHFTSFMSRPLTEHSIYSLYVRPFPPPPPSPPFRFYY